MLKQLKVALPPRWVSYCPKDCQCHFQTLGFSVMQQALKQLGVCSHLLGWSRSVFPFEDFPLCLCLSIIEPISLCLPPAALRQKQMHRLCTQTYDGKRKAPSKSNLLNKQSMRTVMVALAPANSIKKTSNVDIYSRSQKCMGWPK